MKYYIIILTSIICLSFGNRKNVKEVNLLFIGNSMIYYNNMPGILQKMLETESIKYNVSSSAFFGVSLKDHLTKNAVQAGDGTQFFPLNPNEISSTEKLLLSKKWDFVVLQDYELPNLVPQNNVPKLGPVNDDIQDFLRIKNVKISEYILFKVWPNNNPFPKQYNSSLTINNITEEAKIINDYYDYISKLNKLSSVPITDCYVELLKSYRNINLYDGPYHPSEYGAYLNACVFYKFFTKKKASEIKYTANLDDKTVKIIQNVVDKVLILE